MFSDIAISGRALSKCYHIFNKPEDRLKQMLWRGRKAFFKEFWALKDVTFDVRKGETLAVIGRNGSGKSTLLQLICGTLNPTGGDVDVNGKIAALLELGAGFNQEFTGRENVYMNGALLGIDKKGMDARIQEIIEFADIGDFLDQPVKTYSSGMYVRLAFAVAIHCDPEILVVDEALAVGDFLFQQKCNRFLKERFSGVTKLLVTHDMAAVANLADRALVLHHGELVHDGDPQSAIREYQIVARAEENRKIIGPGSATTNPAAVPEEVSIESKPRQWVEIPESRLSGTLRVKIRRCAWEVNGVSNPASVQEGDKVRIYFEAYTNEEIENQIIGFQVMDRFGNAVFGENSVTSHIATPSLKAGNSHLSLDFIWPQIAAGKYAITLGIGSGLDSMNHTIECWAHNIIILAASPIEPVHGLFNVKVQRISIEEVTS